MRKKITYVVLLRAVNVGGTAKLAMADLKRMCTEAGFDVIGTYIQSGNLVLQSSDTADAVKSKLERRLHDAAGKTIQTFIRTGTEMRAVLRANPFPTVDPGLTYAFFLGEKPSRETLATIRRRTDEEIRTGRREIYIYYPSGMGRSKLVIPAAAAATARNMNTVAKLVEMSSESPGTP
jgi:uncharacterized protein (DUF1697 family)